MKMAIYLSQAVKNKINFRCCTTCEIISTIILSKLNLNKKGENNMFLDDELLKMAKEADITTVEGINKLNVDLYRKCEDYYKSKLPENMPASSQIKTILDKTFNLWDNFVRMAKKDSNKQLNILAPLFDKYSFKYQFLQNKDLNRIYQKLC